MLKLYYHQVSAPKRHSPSQKQTEDIGAAALKRESVRKRKGGENREDKSTQYHQWHLILVIDNCINNLSFVCKLITADYKNCRLHRSQNIEDNLGELKIWS